nr:MetaGeneMark_Unknown Function [uncultured bacterium]
MVSGDQALIWDGKSRGNQLNAVTPYHGGLSRAFVKNAKNALFSRLSRGERQRHFRKSPRNIADFLNQQIWLFAQE